MYNGIGKPGAGELVYGPNIADWPEMPALKEHLLLKIAAFITDPVTTTDELIPSGETSSYRSNPVALAEFTLRRKDPAYVPCAKALNAAALERAGTGGEAAGSVPGMEAARAELQAVLAVPELADFAVRGTEAEIQIASALFALKPGDGSAREQAASCQRVLGGAANFANEYATKRYRSNLVNWGLIPFVLEGPPPFTNGDYVFIPHAAALIRGEQAASDARIIRVRAGTSGGVTAEGAGTFALAAPELNAAERELLLAGSLINFNRCNRDKTQRESGA